MNYSFYLTVFICFGLSMSLFGTTESKPVNGGNWNDSNSWPCGCIPGPEGARVPEDYTIFIDGSVQAGIVYVSPGATLIIDNGAGLTSSRISVNLGGTIVNEGTIAIQDDYQGRPNAISNSGLVNNLMSGRILIQDVFRGAAIVNNGGFENTGELRITNVNGIGIDNRGIFSNLGNMIVRDVEDLTIYSAGTSVINEGLISASEGGNDFLRAITGEVINEGVINVSTTDQINIAATDGAVFTNYDELSLSAPNGFLLTCIRGGRFELPDGFIAGNGTIRWCNLDIAGDLSPGFSPGQITIVSDVSFSGDYRWEVGGYGGAGEANGHDHIQVDGNLSFSGSISIELLDGFTPAIGDRFEIFQCQSGCNGNYVAPSSNWEVIVGSNSVELEFMGSVLPVTLRYFSGYTTEKVHHLSWQVMDEDLFEYEVYMRAPGTSSWISVGTVDAENRLDYAFEYSPTESGTYAYRLGMKEHDGTVQFSEIISLSAALSTIDYKISPNPADTEVEVYLWGRFVGITLSSSYGSMVKQWAVEGQDYIKLDIATLRAGVYFITAEGENGKTTKKLIIL